MTKPRDKKKTTPAKVVKKVAPKKRRRERELGDVVGPVTLLGAARKIAALPPAKRLLAEMAMPQCAGISTTLARTTGRERGWWLRVVEQEIARATKPMSKQRARASGLAEKGHGETNPIAWVATLTMGILELAPKGGIYDGNMQLAQALGLVLVTWVSRVQHAKAYDPNRPLKIRRRALLAWQDFVRDVQASLIDERDDACVWPGQRWVAPFTAEAHFGAGDFL